MFQTSVKRNYTTGFPGEVIKDGPFRAKVARIASLTIGTDPAASTNRVSRVFGYSADTPTTGTTVAMDDKLVAVGAPVLFGVLINPKRYALFGTTTGGSLAPALDLPQGAEGEFADMGIIVAELFNEQAATKTINFGDSLAYVPNNITTGNNPQALPYGAIVSYSGALPTGLVAIPNGRVMNGLSLSASAAGAVVSGYTVIQLTQ